MLVTLAGWKTTTSLGALAVRSSQLKAVDDELEAYHKAAAVYAGRYDSALDLRVISLYYAVEHWKKADLTQRDPAHPQDWRKSRRNRNGIITKLADLAFEYSMLAIGTNNASLPASDLEAFRLIETTAKNSFVDLFKGARMVAKHSYKRELAAEIAVGTSSVLGLTDRLMGSSQAAAAADFVNRIVEAVKRLYNSGAATARVIREVVGALGVAQDWFMSCLETVARAVGKALSSIPGISLIVDASSAAQAFYDALAAHLQVVSADRARYLVRTGAVDDAYNTIVQFWRDDRDDNLKAGGKALAGAIVKAVAGALTLGLSAGVELAINIGQKVYSTCKKVFDFINDIVKVVAEYTNINEALSNLTGADFSAAKMFEISPLLACYYFISIPTNNILRFQASMIAMRGSQDVVEAAVTRMAPVIEAAGDFVGESKFMFITRTRKMFPVKCKLNDPTLLEQIKDTMKEAVGDALGDLMPEMPEVVIA
jgi:hypothetical protein